MERLLANSWSLDRNCASRYGATDHQLLGLHPNINNCDLGSSLQRRKCNLSLQNSLPAHRIARSDPRRSAKHGHSMGRRVYLLRWLYVGHRYGAELHNRSMSGAAAAYAHTHTGTDTERVN